MLPSKAFYRYFAKYRKVLKALLIISILGLIFYYFNHYGINTVRANIQKLGIWAPLGIFILRFTSVIMPALPSTAYSLLAGGLFGFKKGIIIICLADALSCSSSFYISRKYGKKIVIRLVGKAFIHKVETLSKRHLENNIFLMTGFLMTGLFDFVSYAIGLSRIPWHNFAKALLISILLSNPPVVALGAGLFEGGNKLLVISLLCVFALSLVTARIRRIKTHQNY